MTLRYNPLTGLFDQVGITQPASGTQDGYLTSSDWTTFNNKLEASRFNYIPSPNAEDTDISLWVAYNDSGSTVAATYVEQDITWTAATPPGNGINIAYVYNASFNFATPNINVISPTSVQIRWHNGPTIAANPTATQMKAAWDAVPAAVAIASCTITGTASDLQYMTGSHVLFGGGDTFPIDMEGGTPSGGLTLTRSTVSPIVETASFLLSKDATNCIGEGRSIDFTINAADKGNDLQISFYYVATANFAFGGSSDVIVCLRDLTNNVAIPLSARTLTGPTAGTIYRFVATFQASDTSVSYRLGFHVSTNNALAWDLKFDEVTVNSVLDAKAATEVPKLVAPAQPITAAVSDHMAVMWKDGNTSWEPATQSGGSDTTAIFGFATNLVGLTADITLRGLLDGFSVGPFIGYNQYIDNVAGGISPLPSPFTDQGVTMGKGVSTDTILVNPLPFNRLVTSKGGLLTNAGANNGTGDQVLAVGSNGTVPVANSAAALGIQWLAPIVAAAPFTFTAATRTLTIATATGSVTGVLTGANFTTFNNKAPTASPTFTGNINSSTGSVLISTIGQGLSIKQGTNSKIGTAILVAGTTTVSNTSTTANSRIFVMSQLDGGTPGFLRITSKVVGTSFTITSSSALDTSTVAWIIIESIP